MPWWQLRHRRRRGASQPTSPNKDAVQRQKFTYRPPRKTSIRGSFYNSGKPTVDPALWDCHECGAWMASRGQKAAGDVMVERRMGGEALMAADEAVLIDIGVPKREIGRILYSISRLQRSSRGTSQHVLASFRDASRSKTDILPTDSRQFYSGTESETSVLAERMRNDDAGRGMEDTLETFRKEVELGMSTDSANDALQRHSSRTRERTGSVSSDSRSRTGSFSSFDKLVDLIRHGPSRRFSKRKPSPLTGTQGPGKFARNSEPHLVNRSQSAPRPRNSSPLLLSRSNTFQGGELTDPVDEAPVKTQRTSAIPPHVMRATTAWKPYDNTPRKGSVDSLASSDDAAWGFDSAGTPPQTPPPKPVQVPMSEPLRHSSMDVRRPSDAESNASERQRGPDGLWIDQDLRRLVTTNQSWRERRISERSDASERSRGADEPQRKQSTRSSYGFGDVDTQPQPQPQASQPAREPDENAHVTDGSPSERPAGTSEPKPGLLRSLGRRAGRAIAQAAQQQHQEEAAPEIKLDPAMQEKMKYLGEDLTPRDRALSFLY